MRVRSWSVAPLFILPALSADFGAKVQATLVASLVSSALRWRVRPESPKSARAQQKVINILPRLVKLSPTWADVRPRLCHPRPIWGDGVPEAHQQIWGNTKMSEFRRNLDRSFSRRCSLPPLRRPSAPLATELSSPPFGCWPLAQDYPLPLLGAGLLRKSGPRCGRSARTCTEMGSPDMDLDDNRSRQWRDETDLALAPASLRDAEPLHVPRNP